MLELKNITLTVNNKTICEDLSVQIAKGTVVLVQGKNGTGKSALIQAIMDSNPLQKGSILIDGHRVHDLGKQQRKLFLESSGIIFQQSLLRPLDTISKSLSHVAGDTIARDRMQKFLGFEFLGRKLIKNLSYAEQRRLDLGRSLVNQPQLALWDEPFLGLDSHWKKQFVQALKELQDLGATIIIATVNPQDFADLHIDNIIQL